MYTIKEIPIGSRDSIEQLGTKEKFWFYDQDGLKKLFKIGRPYTGENWSEKVAYELAKLLDLPCANYELALWNKKTGTVSEHFVPKNGRLIHGNEIIAKIEKNYPKNKFYRVKEYRLTTVLAIIKSIPNLPIGYENHSVISKALGFFIGYLMFDCWISNTDRHHENWGLIFDTKTQKVHLAPTYDHASGLGCRVSDEDRLKRLMTNDERYKVKTFVQRAKSAFFDKDSKVIKTINVLKTSAALDKKAKEYWLNKLDNIEDSRINGIFEKMPPDLMSETSKKFAFELLKENKNRIMELRRELK